MTSPTLTAMERACERIAQSVDQSKWHLFVAQVSRMLAMPAWDYGLWKTKRSLDNMEPEDVIARLRACLESDSPLLRVNQTRVERYSSMGALIREGRELRAIKKFAVKFSRAAE